MPLNKSLIGVGLSFLIVAILFLLAQGSAGSGWVSNGQGTVPTPPAPTDVPATVTSATGRDTATPEPTMEIFTPTNTPTDIATATPTVIGQPEVETGTQPQGAVTRVPVGPYFVAVWDPAKQILTIYATTPGAHIALGGAPLPVGNPVKQAPHVVVPTTTPTPLALNALRGKILFKSDRNGKPFNYYVMNPDGSDIQELNKPLTDALVPAIQGKEGFSPDGTHVVLGERRCYWYIHTCGLYILNTAFDASEIFSDLDLSHGVWFLQNRYKARAPVWSPLGNYIVFVSNHNNPPNCDRTLQVFRGVPSDKSDLRRLTDVCANSDHPTFSPDGSQVAFAYQYPGQPWALGVLDVGSDDHSDYQTSNSHPILADQFNNFDPLWIK